VAYPVLVAVVLVVKGLGVEVDTAERDAEELPLETALLERLGVDDALADDDGVAATTASRYATSNTSRKQ
jgi:hypothetical protein